MFWFARVLRMGSIRMVRPSKRDRPKNGQHCRRIPLDVRDRVRDCTLLLPIGDEHIAVRISASAIEITCSLRTSEKAIAFARA